MSAPSLSNKTRFLQIRKSCESGMHLGYRLGIIVSVLHAYFMFSGKGRRDYVLSAAKKILKTPVLTFAENGGLFRYITPSAGMIMSRCLTSSEMSLLDW